MPIPVATLNRPDIQQAIEIYMPDELQLYASFKRHLGSALMLIQSTDNHNKQLAVYSLYIALECLLKDIFCILRAHTGFKVEFSNLYTRLKGGKGEPLSTFGVKAFGHDLQRLVQFLQGEISDFNSSPDWQALLAILPDRSWTELRYTEIVVRNPDDAFQAIYQTLRSLAGNELRTLIVTGDI